MKKRPVQHHIDGLIALLSFAIFAACVLAVLLTGANAYRRLTRRDQAASDRRIGIQYVAAQVRHADSENSIAVESFDGRDSLVLGAGGEYITRIYDYDGYLMELFSAASDPMSPENGERIMAVNGLALSLEDGLLTVTVTDVRDEESTLTLSLRSGEGGAAA